MRVVLEVLSEMNFGQKVWLTRDQLVSVGRTEQAGFALSRDPTMSGLHFALECDRATCRARDLGSSGGTYVNGNRISEAMLRHGDVLLAGHTRFKVSIEGADLGNVAPNETAAPMGIPEQVLHTVGRWEMRTVPDLWQSIPRGLRRADDDASFSCDLALTEKNALEGVTPAAHLTNLATILTESVPGTEADPVEEIRLHDDQVAWGSVVRYPENGGFSLVQRMLLVDGEARWGSATFTSTADAGEVIEAEAMLILNGLCFRDQT